VRAYARPLPGIRVRVGESDGWDPLGPGVDDGLPHVLSFLPSFWALPPEGWEEPPFTSQRYVRVPW